MKRLLTHTALAAGLLCAAWTAQAQTITLKVHHFLGPQSIQHTTMLKTWCDNIAKDSNNRLNCQIYPAMQLGGTRIAHHEGQLEHLRAGKPASRVAWDFAQKYAQDEYKDVKLLAIHVHGPGVFFTKNKPITKIEDLKGLKVRGPTATVTKMLGMMGATPVGMPVPAVPEALSKGVIDGAVIPFEVAPGLKVHELTKFSTETEKSSPALYTTVFVVPMNKAKYESLPADLKAVIDKNSGREFSAFLGSTQEGNDVPSRKVFADTAGYTMTTLAHSELERWKKATATLDDAWISDMNQRGFQGQAMYDDAVKMIKGYTK